MSLFESTVDPLTYSVFKVMVLFISPPLQTLVLNKLVLSFTEQLF